MSRQAGLGTTSEWIDAPSRQAVAASVAAALAHVDEHVVLQRGDEYVQYSDGVVEWSRGGVVRRAAAAGAQRDWIRRAMLGFFDGESNWHEKLDWDQVAPGQGKGTPSLPLQGENTEAVHQR